MSHVFRLWAPNADAVDVVVGEESARHPMAQAADGSWDVAVDDAAAGTRYAFSLDGGPPRPDPRSVSQPDGVDAASEVVDLGSFRWTDAGWKGIDWTQAIVYELHIGTFTAAGTFDAAIERLDHLVSLGVDAVELLPVAQFSGNRGWGYDGVDLYAPHSAYGGPVGLQRFVDAAHARGIAVVLDVVYNHLGPAGNYLQEFGPYFTDRYATPWGMAVNVDGEGSDEVRRFVLDNARQWLVDFHIDGLRLDAVHAVIDTSSVHWLEQLGSSVDEIAASTGVTRFVVAESDLNDPRLITPRSPDGTPAGYGLHAQWNDDFHHCLHTLLTGEDKGYYESYGRLSQLATAYERAYVYAGEFEPHRGRRHGRPPIGRAGWQFLGYLQNHDQIGNRAQGDRSSHLLDVDQLKLAAALVLTSPFVPMLFMGEEWGASSPFQYFTDHHDPELGRAVSEGRRSEFAYFGWSPDEVPDPQDPATFERSKLSWDESEGGVHADLLDWHRLLIGLRRAQPAAFGAASRLDGVGVRFVADDGWIAVSRGGGTVVANVSSTESVVADVIAPGASVIASNGAEIVGTECRLRPWGVAVLSS